ncbi:disulfide oxidoreductase [Paenibacillus arenosi]|uniref:Disulfide bond formation protein B n=1 Tax=Paenibacillus arenosi TaxID=2774142 RepID=A0ABR9B0D0_9BACL|nr:disulfide oxidoreductase [Paenibacillus arenosi]MBD8499854.1 disulfide bond formation protein B [Paenibacillus arenosi]
MSFFRRYGLYMAWIVALVATAGSLYMSEILLWEPCKLCWLQRIFMYPLVLLLGIAAYRNDHSIIVYALPFPIIGGGISIYHYLLQKVESFALKMGPCKVGVPCNFDYLEGWLTIPMLALIAFILIILLLVVGRKPE